MNGERLRKQGGTGLVVAGLALVIVTLPLLTGCGSEADSNTLLTPGTDTAVPGTSPPTLSELTAGAHLTEAQARSLAPALTRWREQAGSRDPRRAGRFGAGPEGAGVQEPPMHAFLLDCAAALDTDRFVAVVTYLAERRDAHRSRMQATATERRAERRAERAGRAERRSLREGRGLRADGFRRGNVHGDGPRAGMRGFLADLELTRDQRTALRDAMQTARRTLRETHRSYVQGDLDADGVKGRGQEAVDALGASLKASLTAEQFQVVVDGMRERTREMAGRRLEHLDRMGTRQAAFLTKVLALDADQAAGMEQAHDAARSRTKTLLTGVQGGSVGFADAVYGALVIHEDLKTAIRALLDEDQIRRLDALETLRGGGGPRPFPITL